MSVANHRATPAGVAQQSQALPPGTRLGEFEVVSLLGVGGFGMVYQAFDHQLQRFVAIKEYMPAALAGRDYVIPEDVSALAGIVLAHRILPTVEAQVARRDPASIIASALGAIPIPERR